MVLAAALVLVVLPAAGARWDKVCVFLLLPLLVAAGMGRSSLHVGPAIGNSSYPTYVLHFPLIVLAVEASRPLATSPVRLLIGPVAAVVILLVAWMALRAYDASARRALSLRLLGRAGRSRQPAGEAVATACVPGSRSRDGIRNVGR